jgi:hypothetical protein
VIVTRRQGVSAPAKIPVAQLKNPHHQTPSRQQRLDEAVLPSSREERIHSQRYGDHRQRQVDRYRERADFGSLWDLRSLYPVANGCQCGICLPARKDGDCRPVLHRGKRGGIGVALGIAGDGHKLPFSAYLAILFKVHRMLLLGFYSAPFDQPVRGYLSRVVSHRIVCL